MPTKAAVIGSGFGGLAAAIRLQAQGVQTTLFEKRDKPGGRAYVYQDQGFTFDAGPTVITAPGCLEELFALGGKSMQDYIELKQVAPLYRLYWEDGTVMDYTQDIQSTLKEIERVAPEDVEGYKKFLAYTEEVFEEGYTKLAHVPFLHLTDMVPVSPQLMRLQAYRSVYAIVSKYLKSNYLRQAFSFHSLLVGGNPFTTSSIYTLIHFLERKWGVFFPKGGTSALVSALVRYFEDLGGKIELGAEIDHIRTHHGKVAGITMLNGRSEDFDFVVSNADVHHTYHHLLRRTDLVSPMRKKLARSRYSMSLFLTYFGTNRQYPELKHHNVLFGPRYKELLEDIFKRGILADDFSLYLHSPTKTDPSMAPPGCEAFYVLSPVPHLGKMDVDWNVVGPQYAEKILKYLEQHYLPDLTRHIVTQRIFTPADFKTELNSHLGSAFSLEPLLTQSAAFRVRNEDAKIEGLYFVGAGTHPGAGVPGVVNSAKATVGLILEKLYAPVKGTEVMPLESGSDPVLQHCKQMIEVGSKSFSLAAKLFTPETRDAAFFLYGWCRYSDDEADAKTENGTARVKVLLEKTQRAFRGEAPNEPVFVALQHIVKKYSIPEVYALDLIQGLENDQSKKTYSTLKELEVYCYQVAGTVGLMMSHIMGVSSERAMRHALSMGMAMQLTNIARDIREDAEMGRIYLPMHWMEESGVRLEDLLKRGDKVAPLARRLVEAAGIHYEIGRDGLQYLPWRAALAVAVASKVYEDIGRLVLERGSLAWETRTIVSFPRKLWAVLRGVGLVLKTVPYRLSHPFTRANLLNPVRVT